MRLSEEIMNVLEQIAKLSVQAVELEKEGVRNALITLGASHLGKPYVFGAVGGQTVNFDCSSFTQHLYKEIGMDIPRNSRQQATVGEEVTSRQAVDLVTGDLLFFSDTTDKQAKGVIDHVAMYVGSGVMLHTIPNVGVGFVRANSYWIGKWVSTRRII
jgi:cell wall-associated NlpC family hydrolase